MATSEKIQVNPTTLAKIGVLTEDDLQEALAAAKAQGVDPIVYLTREKIVELEDVHRAHALEGGYPYFNQDTLRPSREVLALIPHAVARELSVVPVKVVDDRLLIAVLNPTRALRAALEGQLHFELDYAIASKQTLDYKVQEYYSAAAEAASITISTGMKVVNDAPDLDALLASGDSGGDQSVSRNVKLLIVEGLSRKASDIHLEPFADTVRVRYRVDNQLRTATDASYPKDVGALIIARIKVMSGLNTAETRRPQDGRITFSNDGKKVDLRVAVVPVSGGEKVVLRILANDLAGKPLHELDFTPRNLRILRTALRRPHGMILVTGPTGSGKSTTLYSGIGEVATDTVNVMTAEDPVEYKFDGINQVQINEDHGVTFPNALRSFLRADPDVILVGEIRDEETARIAIKASLTGHLVLSTLHTNSAALTVSRLLEMNIEPYLVSDALACVLSQRLARRLCAECRIEYIPTTSEVLALAGDVVDPLPTIYRANQGGACRYCGGRGYRGRIPIHEMLPVTSKIKDAISQAFSGKEIEDIAMSEGKMRTLKQDGWEKIVAGLTDIDQIAALDGNADFDDIDDVVA